LTPLVQDALFGIVAHAAGTDLVNAIAGRVDPVRLADDFPTGFMEPFLYAVGGILAEVAFIFAVARLNVKHRNSPAVFHIRVDADVVLKARNTLAEDAAGHA